MQADTRMAGDAIGMARGTVLRIEDGLGCVVTVRKGALWLTQERDARDRYLGAGESFRLDRDGLALACALRHSTVSLASPARATLVSRLRRFWAGLFASQARPTTAAL